MKVVSERERIRNVSLAWDKQYGHEPWNDDKDKTAVGDALRALNLSRVSAQTVDMIIGNNSWTSIFCTNCGLLVKEAVQFFDSCDEATMIICLPCLKRAAKMLASQQAHP